MRALAVAALVAMTASWGAGAYEPKTLPPGVSPEDARAGCLRSDLRQCMIALGAVLWYDMNQVAPALAHRNDLDVNGRVANRKVAFMVGVPGHAARSHVTLTLASPPPNDLIVKVEATLPFDPSLARTQAEYDRTEFYAVVGPLLGNHCPTLNPMMLYRFFENEVKPRIKVETNVRKYGIFNHTKQTGQAGPLPFCGFSFSYRRHASWNGAPDTPNPTGFIGGIAIAIE